MKNPHVQVALLTNRLADALERNQRLLEYVRHHYACRFVFAGEACSCGLEGVLRDLPSSPTVLANEGVAVEDGSDQKLAVEAVQRKIEPTAEGL